MQTTCFLNENSQNNPSVYFMPSVMSLNVEARFWGGYILFQFNEVSQQNSKTSIKTDHGALFYRLRAISKDSLYNLF